MESLTPDPPARATLACTVLHLLGRDVLDVLHRISTQSLSDLGPGEVRMTLFCDFRGRLLHRAAVAVTADGSVWLLRDDAAPEELAAHVERHVFREDVRIDVTSRLAVRAVEGGFDLAPGTATEQDGVPAKLQIAERFGLRLDDPLETPPEPDDEHLRILAGRPRHGREVEPSFNPFEVGLAHELHLDKGCYTGQEALMRMVTYRGVRRAFVRLAGRGPSPEAPRDVHGPDGVVGRLTSTASNGSGWTGLAVLRREVIAAPVRMQIEGWGEVDWCEPFPETRPQGLP